MAKRRLAKKYGIAMIKNSEILKAYRELVNSGLKKEQPAFLVLLRKRSVRTLSGIAPVAVLTEPFPCPGQCAYCPTEKDVPQSYLSNEPAVMRAIRCEYDPYTQVTMRLRALVNNGHSPNKIELIVIGGTWSVLPEQYKYWYILNCFKAANDFDKNTKYNIQNTKYKTKTSVKTLKKLLAEEQRKNESTEYKIIGITLETRPDYIDEKEVLEMRDLGCTRVELGVQAIDDGILKINKRGHGVAEIATATKLLKDFGFKVTYHIMPGLPGSTPARDIKMYKQLFTDGRFQPDQIKFYPTVVTKGSLLYRWWRAGKYKPYTDKQLENIIIKCKEATPPYVRIIRLIRDIPSESIVAGNIITNLRQVIQQRGVTCRCIRCREAKDQKFKIKNLELRITEYKASAGKEYFIAAESKDGNILYGFCRLRLPYQTQSTISNDDNAANSILNTAYCILKNAALIRELHVYGELVPAGGQKKVQHAGLGKKLLAAAEKIAKENGYKKIAVIAGVGVRDYYRKRGYELTDYGYMTKG